MSIYEADPSTPETVRQRAIEACTGSPRWHGSLALPRTTPTQPAVTGLKPGDCVTYQDGTTWCPSDAWFRIAPKGDGIYPYAHTTTFRYTDHRGITRYSRTTCRFTSSHTDCTSD